jgi:hypothetical protein
VELRAHRPVPLVVVEDCRPGPVVVVDEPEPDTCPRPVVVLVVVDAGETPGAGEEVEVVAGRVVVVVVGGTVVGGTVVVVVVATGMITVARVSVVLAGGYRYSRVANPMNAAAMSTVDRRKGTRR